MEWVIVISIFAGLGLLGMFLRSAFNSQKTQLDEIHVLVNSRLTEALDNIAHLKKMLAAERKGKRK